MAKDSEDKPRPRKAKADAKDGHATRAERRARRAKNRTAPEKGKR